MFPTEEHIHAAQNAADDEEHQSGVYVWPSTALVQAKLESAGWTKLTGKNNGFGVKATQAQRDAGAATLCWTREVVAGKNTRVQQWFADYPSLRAAYDAHAHLLATSKYYIAARHDDNPEQFLIDIAHRYATDPAYARVALGIMRAGDYRQYDRAPTIGAPKLKPPITATQQGHAPATSGVVIAGATAAAAWGGHLGVLAIGLGFVAAAACVAYGVRKYQAAHELLATIVTPPTADMLPKPPAPVAAPPAPVATVAAKVSRSPGT